MRDDLGGELMRRFVAPVLMLFVLVVASSCVTSPGDNAEEAPPAISPEAAARLLPAGLKDPGGWTRDILAGITAADRVPNAERVCAVVAVIQQESGFEPNPTVAHLPQLVREGMLKKLASLGPLAEPALAALLAGRAPGAKHTFGERIDKMRTEQDLDRFFREMADTYHDAMPGPYAVATALSFLMGKGSLRNLNPITTAGVMQVKVWFAKGLDPDLSDEEVRDKLYTRAGGVRAGAVRLLGYKANYDDIVYRFADYNGGMYTARNAEFQQLLNDLTGRSLALDGDLLSYNERGDAKSDDTESLKAMLAFAKGRGTWAVTVRRDASKEKTEEFEATTVWDEVREAWQEKTGKAPPYARLPEIELKSPKIKRALTTAWYANSVKRHYTQCRARE